MVAEWEYEVEVFEVESLAPKSDAVKARLNQLGANGWEIVGVTPLLGPEVRLRSSALPTSPTETRTRALTVILKRPLQRAT